MLIAYESTLKVDLTLCADVLFCENRANIYSRFSNNYEISASELLENRKEIYYLKNFVQINYTIM